MKFFILDKVSSSHDHKKVRIAIDMNKRTKAKITVEENPVELFSEPEKIIGVEKFSLKKEIEHKNLEIDKTQFDKDLEKLICLSAEVRTIARNAVISSAERILQAQEILKKYKKGAFTAWLKMTYGNRQTPYNILYYHKLHQQLPNDSRLLFAKMPQKAAYLLGARNGDTEDKIDFIKKYNERNQNELLSLIEERFPLNHSNQNENACRDFVIAPASLKSMRLGFKEVKSWKKEKKVLDPKLIEELREFRDFLDQILTEKN